MSYWVNKLLDLWLLSMISGLVHRREKIGYNVDLVFGALIGTAATNIRKVLNIIRIWLLFFLIS